MLVPKSQYEHLLKLTKESDQNEQSGGQVDNQVDIPPPESNIKTKDNVSNEKTSSSEDSKGDDENNGEQEKPRLYVNKPLSKMPFDNPHVIASSAKKAESVKPPFKNGKIRRWLVD